MLQHLRSIRSGVGLHKRGYRFEQGEAPLKETLAAAFVMLTNWQPDEMLIDPFCGSGTIPIEAALSDKISLLAFNRSFVSEEWDFIPNVKWEKAYEEAEQLSQL